MKTWIAAAVLALALTAPVLAQTREDVVAAIEANFGDAAAVEEAVDAIQTAVAEGDAESFAEWVSYPFSVTVDGEDYVFDGPDGVVEHYESMMTPEIEEAILDQSFETLFVNAEGIMFGDGQLWLSAICTDDSCAESDIRIIALQSTAP
jgi:hypothetical protein